MSALYRYDTPEGIRITFTDEKVGDLEECFQIVKDGYDDLWRDAVYECKTRRVLDLMFSELAEIGKRKRKRLGIKRSAALFGAIYMLESIGRLKTDKHNGIQFEYAQVN